MNYLILVLDELGRCHVLGLAVLHELVQESLLLVLVNGLSELDVVLDKLKVAGRVACDFSQHMRHSYAVPLLGRLQGLDGNALAVQDCLVLVYGARFFRIGG